MKLTQYINESGETQWRTNHGTVIPNDLVEKWQDDAIRIKTRTQESKQYLKYLQQLIASQRDENN
jgi:hypothetical protein